MIVELSLILIALLIFYQDWKTRTIHIALPIAFFGLGLYHTFGLLNWFDYGMNTLFFLIIFCGLVGFMTFKEGSFRNPFEHYFGLGDFLFFLALTPLFFLYHFALFFIASLCFSVVLHLALSKWMQHKTVPLAGFVALFFIIGYLAHIFFPLSLFNIML